VISAPILQAMPRRNRSHCRDGCRRRQLSVYGFCLLSLLGGNEGYFRLESHVPPTKTFQFKGRRK
jgi:hypothetical protein